jgi:hypothetical protein
MEKMIMKHFKNFFYSGGPSIAVMASHVPQGPGTNAASGASDTVSSGTVSAGSELTTNATDEIFTTLNPANWVIGDAFTASLARLFVAIAIVSVVVMAMVSVAIYGISRAESKAAAKELIISKLVIVVLIGAGTLILDGIVALAVSLF